jgi:MoxR-like ATPase
MVGSQRTVALDGDEGGQMGWHAERFAAIQDNVEAVVRGKPEVVHLALVCLLAEGHLLVEDVPGVGKTSLARALAVSIGSEWQRIQFTPDLLPSDVTGVTIYDQATGSFRFKRGPVFAGVVVADEINRASPKTQAALLEVMEERTVTIDGESHEVPRPFMVIATQNPVDMDGTYPLPEAQIDRFLMRISVGYPDHAAELEIVDAHHKGANPHDVLVAAASPDVVRSLVAGCRDVHIDPAVKDYLVRLVAATRHRPEVRLGASPRASVALLRAVCVEAASAGRAFALPEDVRTLAVPVLAHRLLLTAEAEARGVTVTEVIEQVLAGEAVPSMEAV